MILHLSPKTSILKNNHHVQFPNNPILVLFIQLLENQKHNYKNYGNGTKENLKMIKNMDMVFYILLMEVSLKDNLLMVKLMGQEVL